MNGGTKCNFLEIKSQNSYRGKGQIQSNSKESDKNIITCGFKLKLF